VLKEGIVYRKWVEDSTLQERMLFLVPEHLRYMVLNFSHEHSGHFGRFKMLQKLKQQFYWPKMSKAVEVWVASCDTCQQRKNPHNKAPLVPIPKSYPRALCFLDSKGPL
jgi:hypothetical protein